MWRRIIKIDKIILATIKIRDCLNKTMYSGKARPLESEAKETILAIKKTTNQVRTVIPKIILKPLILTAKAINTPKVAAIPLPPLNLKKIVQLWPHMQLIPKIIRNNSSEINVDLAAAKSPN